MMKQTCHECNEVLQKDVISLNKKLLGKAKNRLYCLDCLADYLRTKKEDLLIKIIEFKEQGCDLFK